MLDIKFLRDDFEAVKKALQRRGGEFYLDRILVIDEQRRTLVHQMEQLRAEQNKTSQEIAQRKKNTVCCDELLAVMKDVSVGIKTLEEQIRHVDAQRDEMMLAIPNLPDSTVPDGVDESANQVLRSWGEIPKFDFEVKDHVSLGENLGIMDFERAAKITGARFNLAVGVGAKLERALINFMLDIHTEIHGYTEVLPPFLVNSTSMLGTGQLPKFTADSFHVQEQDLWLIPTAEVPVTNIHRDEILTDAQLPIKYTAYTPCFRSEAGSHGKDTRGMIRQHQFNKVELVQLARPEESWDALEQLTRDAETILQRLELPYRVVALCTGDLGFSAAKTYDLEVWLPGQDTYREISSCSNFTDFQARRANIRFKRDKKPEFVHTLNGSGLAVGRTVVALLENGQQEDGTVRIPAALQPYLNGCKEILPNTA